MATRTKIANAAKKIADSAAGEKRGNTKCGRNDCNGAVGISQFSDIELEAIIPITFPMNRCDAVPEIVSYLVESLSQGGNALANCSVVAAVGAAPNGVEKRFVV